MTLSAQHLVDCRRWMGYSLSGNSTSYPYRELVYSDVSYMGLSLDYRLSNMTTEEEGVLIATYLTPLALREQEIQGAACNLDTDVAAVWKHNAREVNDRIELFNYTRRQLCVFLGFPPGPQLSSGNSLVRG